jgi:hypothetical protein
MPFDATTFRQPSVRILPPTITGRGGNLTLPSLERGGGGPQRIRIEIEITDRRARPAQRPRFGVLQLLLALILLALLFLPTVDADLGTALARLGKSALKGPQTWPLGSSHRRFSYPGGS